MVELRAVDYIAIVLLLLAFGSIWLGACFFSLIGTACRELVCSEYEQ